MKARFLLDANIIIDHIGGFRLLPERVFKSETILFSQVAMAEIKVGFDDTRRGHKDKEVFEKVLRLPNVVQITLTSATADLYARVFRSLRAAGTPIPINDIWLAAQALEHGAILVSRDRHFEAVANLQTMILEN